MRGEHIGVVHAVELVAGEDQHVIGFRFLHVAQVLPHGIGGALIPIRAFVGLLGGENFDEAPAEAVEHIRAADVAVQTHGVELREHVHAVHAAVDAVRERDIDQPIFPRQRHGRLRAKFRQRIKPSAASAAEN